MSVDKDSQVQSSQGLQQLAVVEAVRRQLLLYQVVGQQQSQVRGHHHRACIHIHTLLLFVLHFRKSRQLDRHTHISTFKSLIHRSQHGDWLRAGQVV